MLPRLPSPNDFRPPRATCGILETKTEDPQETYRMHRYRKHNAKSFMNDANRWNVNNRRTVDRPLRSTYANGDHSRSNISQTAKHLMKMNNHVIHFTLSPSTFAAPIEYLESNKMPLPVPSDSSLPEPPIVPRYSFHHVTRVLFTCC